MKKLTFEEKEVQRIHILKEISEGKITQVYGAETLGISVRQMRRLQRDFELLGDESVIHGLKGRVGNRPRIDTKKILDIAKQDDFRDFKPTLLTEYVREHYGVEASVETVRKTLIDAHLRESKSKKSHIYRQQRARKAVYGMMVQFDGSYHRWLENRYPEELCLLLAVDDATGDNMFGKLCKNEGFACVCGFRIDYILKFGVPRTIYLDRFSSYKVNHPNAEYDKSMITNFERVMKKLGCELIFARSPQAKGRVERRNYLWQDRLVKELRINKINDVVIANLYIQETFIPHCNEKFSVDAQMMGDAHIPCTYTRKELENMFTKNEIRIVQQDFIVQYKSKFYQTFPGNYPLYPQKKIEVHENYKGEISLRINDKYIEFKEVETKTVKIQRAKYRSEYNKTKKEKQKIDLENRLKARHEASKKRQMLQKPLDLL